MKEEWTIFQGKGEALAETYVIFVPAQRAMYKTELYTSFFRFLARNVHEQFLPIYPAVPQKKRTELTHLVDRKRHVRALCFTLVKLVVIQTSEKLN